MRGLITPSKIVSNNKGKLTSQNFSQFMGGEGEYIGSSIANSANNIVNFSRPTVTPITPDFSSVLGTISTNINNFTTEINQNIQTHIQKITENINKTFFNTVQRLQTDSQNILSSTIQKFTTEYREQIKETADNQPSNVLKNFQNLYKSTIDFVTFLGDSKTNNRITKSLVSLRKMFEESLNVSTVIREAIVKIVDQLTNLPSASPSAGGLELDVDVPGGPLKQTGGSLGRTGGRSGLGRRLGLGALGLGIGAAGVGVGAAGAGMLSAKKFQEEKLQSTKSQAQPQEQMIPDDFIRNFQKLIEVFDTSINNLINFVKSSSGEDTGRTSPGGGGGNPPGTSKTGPTIQGNVGEVIAEDASASWYDPALGGINASGAKTKEGLPATSTGEGFQSNKFTAAAFPSLLRRLPSNMTTPSANNPSGRTLSSGNAFNVIVVGKNGKAAVVRVNDVGSGVSGQPSNRMLDFSPAVRDYFGKDLSGFKIISAPSNLAPGPISAEQIQKISDQSSQSSIQSNNPQATFTPQAAPSQVAPNPTPTTQLETSSLNNPLSTVTVASLPQQPPSFLPSEGGSSQQVLQSSGGEAGPNSGVDVGRISSKNLFGGFSLITEHNLNIFHA